MARKKKGAKPTQYRRSTPDRDPAAERSYVRWYNAKDDHLAEAVEGRARMLWDDDSARRLEVEKNLRRWGITLAGLYLDNTLFNKDAMRVNITKSLTETITANVGKQRPRPLVLTDDGKWTNRMRAKKLQRFLDAVYSQTEAYMLFPGWFRNAMLCGTGSLFVGGDAYRARFELENVFPLELLVDNCAGSRGERYTRELFRVYPWDKDTLIELYPDDEGAINSAPLYGIDNMFPANDITSGLSRDLRTCMVTEAWRKAGWTAKGELIPGCWVRTVNGCVLERREWLTDTFPFVFLSWNEPERGFWGESAVAEIRGIEREANVALQRGQDAMRRGGMPIVFSPASAELKMAKLSNEPFISVPYEGQVPPQAVVMPAAHPDLLGTPDRLITMAQNQLGTNQMQVSAERPAGTESGRMLEQLSETHSARFDTVAKRLEHAGSKLLAQQFVAVAKRMDTQLKEDGRPGLRLRSTYKKEVIDLRFDEVELGPDELFLEVWPVSVLPHTPSGKTAEIERWQNNQWVTADQSKQLLDFPDLESTASLSRASADLFDWQLGQMLDEGVQVVPDRRQNLQEAYDHGTHAKLKAQREKVPASNIALLEDFLLILEEWLAPPPAAPVPTDAMPVPGDEADSAALGGPAPVTDDPGALLGMGATPAVASPMGLDPALLGAGM